MIWKCHREACAEDGRNTCCMNCELTGSCTNPCADNPFTCGHSEVQEAEHADDEKGLALQFTNANLALFQKIREIVNAKKALEEQEKALKDKLREAMEKYGIKAVDSDVVKVTYIAPSTATTIDSAKLKKLYPQIAETCSKQTARSAYVKIEVKEG